MKLSQVALTFDVFFAEIFRLDKKKKIKLNALKLSKIVASYHFGIRRGKRFVCENLNKSYQKRKITKFFTISI